MPLARWPFTALGLALAGVASVNLWLRGGPWNDSAEFGATASTGSSAGADATRRGLKPPPPGTGGWRDLDAPVEPSVPAGDDAPVRPVPLPSQAAESGVSVAPALSDEAVWSHYQPTPEELAYRAYKVEQEANAELRNLLKVLDLGEAQQDRVFAALARSSSYYHPALQPQGARGTPIGSGGPSTAAPGASPVPGSPEGGGGVTPSPSPAAPADPVMVELTPEEADVYERYTSERDAFWAGVVEDIEMEINDSP